MTFNPPVAPQAPSTARPETFAEQADAFVAWMAAFGAAINAAGGLATASQLVDIDADTFGGKGPSSYLRRDAGGHSMLGLLHFARPDDEQMRIGYNTGGERATYVSFWDGETARRGFIDFGSSYSSWGRDGGAVVSIHGVGDARINGHRVHHDGNKSEYISPETTIGSGYPVTLAHGLGARPRQIDLYLVCKTAQYGYSPGAEVHIPSGESFADWGAQAQTANDSEIRVVFGNSGFVVLDAVTGRRGAIAGAGFSNWKLKVRASL